MSGTKCDEVYKNYYLTHGPEVLLGREGTIFVEEMI